MIIPKYKERIKALFSLGAIALEEKPFSLKLSTNFLENKDTMLI